MAIGIEVLGAVWRSARVGPLVVRAFLMAGFGGSLHVDSAGPVIVGGWVEWEGLMVVTLNAVVENASGGSVYFPGYTPLRVSSSNSINSPCSISTHLIHLYGQWRARGVEPATRNLPVPDGLPRDANRFDGIPSSPASRSLRNGDFPSFPSPSPPPSMPPSCSCSCAEF